jgi:DNA (cytosine-5)-methyltransferase 1
MNAHATQLSLLEAGLVTPHQRLMQSPSLKYNLDLMKSARAFREPAKVVGQVAELFAGVGGFRLGLAKSGWKTVFSNQWEPSTQTQHASNVYVARFGSAGHSNADIATVASLPKGIDLLVGGFPCQDYSVAKTLRSATGLEGKKGVLWWEILRLVEKHRPTFVFLENVDRLLKSPSSQRGRDFAIMLKTLADAGYAIEWRVVNAAEYGFPQRRIRVFIVATRVRRGERLDTSEQVISKSGILARGLPIGELLSPIATIDLSGDAAAISRGFNRGGGKTPFSNSGWYINGIAYTAKTAAQVASESLVLADIVQDDAEVPEEYWIASGQLAGWKYLKGAKMIPRVHKGTGFTYNYSEGRMAFPDLLNNPSRTILTGEGGATPSRFKHIIKVGRRYRRLTPIELERLNGFPDDWTKYDCEGNQLPDSRRAFFMGNALVVGLVEKVGKVLAEEIQLRTLRRSS